MQSGISFFAIGKVYTVFSQTAANVLTTVFHRCGRKALFYSDHNPSGMLFVEGARITV